MEAWQLGKLVDTLEKLKTRKITGIPNMMTYVVIPYVASLGYDVYNFDNSEISLDEGKIVVKVDDTLHLVISLISEKPYYQEQRMFLHLDEIAQEMQLHFKVLGLWEQVLTVNLKEKTGTSDYTDLLRYTMRDRLTPEYKQKGERLLTEGVLNRNLEAGNWDNEFLLNVLVEELKNPSEGFIEVLANRLGETYTTKDKNWVQERLTPIQEEGLVNVVNRANDSGKLVKESKSFQSQVTKKLEEDTVQPVNTRVETQPEEPADPFSDSKTYDNEDILDNDNLETILSGIPTT